MGEKHVKLHRGVDSVGILMKVQKISPGGLDRETFQSQGTAITCYI